MRITAGRATAPLILCRPTCMSLGAEDPVCTYRAYPYRATDVSTRGQIYAEAPKLVPTPQTMFGARVPIAIMHSNVGHSGRRGGDRRLPLTFTDCASRSVVRHFYFCHRHPLINSFTDRYFFSAVCFAPQILYTVLNCRKIRKYLYNKDIRN